jgi:hypothetical protein
MTHADAGRFHLMLPGNDGGCTAWLSRQKCSTTDRMGTQVSQGASLVYSSALFISSNCSLVISPLAKRSFSTWSGFSGEIAGLC